MNIQSNSQESSLTTLKNKIRCMCNEHDTNSLLEEINENCKTFNLSIEKYARGIIDSIEGKDIKSPYPYIKKVAWNLALEHTKDFAISNRLPNFVELSLKLKEIGMTGEEWESDLIDEIITHCLLNFPIELEDMLDTIRAIVDFCESRKALTYRDYIKFLMSSKIVKKCNVPLQRLEKKAKQEREEIDEIMKGITKWKN